VTLTEPWLQFSKDQLGLEFEAAWLAACVDYEKEWQTGREVKPWPVGGPSLRVKGGFHRGAAALEILLHRSA
jgi:hypothetical protein